MRMRGKIFAVLLFFVICCIHAEAQIITTICGDGTSGSAFDGMPAHLGWIAGPRGATKGYGNKIYYSDSRADKVRFIGANGIIGTIAGNGTAGYSGDGGLAINAALYNPTKVITDNAGNVYFIDQYYGVIRKVSVSGIITTIAGGQGFGYAGDGGPLALAQFRTINDICFDNAGNLYIVDWWTSVVRKVNMTTGIITTVVGTGNLGFSGDGGPATAANTNGIEGVLVDNAGNIYITDADNSRIRKINPAGIITTIAGTGVAGNTGDGGPATAATLNYPFDLAIDAAGNLYVSDYSATAVVRMITPAGIISRYAGTGTSGYSGDGGLPTAAQISGPDISIDAEGIMYISDYDNNRIRAIFCPEINIVQQSVTDTTICTANGDSARMYVVAEYATGYQWQVNTGSGWTNIANNAVYSGATTSSLLVDGVTAAMNNYQYRCRTYNNCSELFSDAVTIHVLEAVAAPTVTIVASATTVCPGTPVTFTATATNAGSSPTYTWRRNGIPFGNGVSFTTSVLVNGDVVSCDLIASNLCAISNNATSDAITMVMHPIPTISIAASANNICEGTGVLFTATITNPGTATVYQWQVNGVNVGTNSSIFASNALVNGDIVTCSYSSTGTCGSGVVTSNAILMAVNTISPPAILIFVASDCESVFFDLFLGNPITFNASIANGGSAPVYQWKRNGVNVGANSPSYTSALTFGDVITCVLTSNSPCASPNTATSNAIPIDLAGGVDPSITIAGSSNDICAGTSVTFTATITNPGGSPIYQWKKNGVNVGTNSDTYTTTALANGDLITCTYRSTGSCGPSEVNSSLILMRVNTLSPPTVSIAVSGNCGSMVSDVVAGNPINFWAVVTNGGSAPVYQWKKNGVNIGTNSPFYTGVVSVGDVITCVVTSNSPCATINTATSNAIQIDITNAADQPTITLNASSDMCEIGVPVTFTATIAGGGSSPTFQWKKNGVNVGTNSSTYTENTPVDGDMFSCTVTSSAACATTPAATTYITYTCTTCGPTGAIITTIVSSVNAPLGAVKGFGGNIYYTHAAKVSMLTPAGVIVDLAGQNVPGYSGDGGPATAATTAFPAVVITANDGTIYFNEFTNKVLRKINTAGIISTIANTLGAGGEGSPLNLHRFRSIEDIFLDNAGNLYIVDAVGHTVKKVNMATNQTITIAGTGTPGFSGDGGPATLAQLRSPSSVAVDNLGNIYITDEQNYRVRKIDPAGIITTIAGTGVSGKGGDGGPAIAATLFKPHDLSIGNDRSIYIGDWGNGVRKIAPNGIITRVAGNGTVGYSGDGGPATQAQTVATNVAVDEENNIYISDFEFNAIRKVSCPFITINRHPADTTLCNTSGNINFSIQACNVESYQWQVNTGSGWTDITNNAMYSGATTSKLNVTGVTVAMNNYQYRCRTYSPCNTIFSSAAVLRVLPQNIPAITIVTATATVCQGANGVFTATPQFGGSVPSYQWKKNGIDVGINSNNYTDNTLVNGDQITCVLTPSPDECVTTPTVTSNTITVTVNPVVTPTINITESANNVCSGTPVTFTLTSANAGSAPFYQWQKNGVNVAAGITYTDNTLNNGDVIRCALISNATCTAGSGWAFSNSITINIVSVVTPTITITPTGNNVCAGTSVTFNAAITNGGSAPSYQWKKNGVNVGTNTDGYTDNTLNDGDVITCELTSNSTCATVPLASSNGVTMIVNPITPPSISIAASSGTICAGTQVTFTSVIGNGGGSPVYQWKKNGVNVGTNSNSYADNTLNDGDVISCVLTPSATCAIPATATSNDIVMIVNPLLNPSISISPSGNTICAGTTITFSSVINNGGSAPSYQWKKNGVNVGTNNNSYTDNTLDNTDIILCELTSNAVCATPPLVTSNSVVMIVNPLLTPSVSIVASDNNICAGSPVVFSASVNNGGASPTYQWKKNGVNVGTNSSSYNDNSLANDDIISCELTSDAICATPVFAGSNSITMLVNPVTTATLSITATSAVICAGTTVTFSTTITNGGNAPVYQWKKNGINVGINNSSYADNTLNNGDIISCELTSNKVCVTASMVTSNSITMTVNPVLMPSINIAVSDNTICAGTNVNFTATITNGGSTPSYQWKVNGTAVGANSAVYSSAALNNNDIITCELESGYTCALPALVVSNEVQMVVDPVLTPAVTISTTDNSICDGASAVFNATAIEAGALPAYEWRKNGLPVGTSSPVYTDNALNNSDIITCMITANANCLTNPTANSNIITMTIYDNPVISLDQTPTLCTGATRQLDPGQFTSYVWSTGQTSRVLNVTNAGTYSVTVTDNNGCNGSASTVITTMLPQPGGFLPTDTSFCRFGSLTLQPFSNYNSYAWSTGAVSSSITIDQPGTYWLEVTNSDNCKGRSSIQVVMKQCLKGLYVPNAFTPGRDGKNDVFKALLFGDIRRYELIVYNRWGNVVFRTKDPNKGWDGTFKGAETGTAVFVWVCSYQLEGEPAKVEKGTVTLIK